MSAPATASTTGPARGHRKLRVGMVTSNKMQKTIVVQVQRLIRHPVYDRVMKRRNSFKVHDESNRANVGDWVKIMETRPLSKDKRWCLVAVVKQASTAPPVPGGEEVVPKHSKAMPPAEGVA